MQQDYALPDSPISCIHHNALKTGLVCAHLVNVPPDVDYYRRFNGSDQQFAIVCKTCFDRLQQDDSAIPLQQICWRCWQEIVEHGCWEGIVGSPPILARNTNLSFAWQHSPLPLLPPIRVMQPLNNGTDSTWIALTHTNELIHINLTTAKITPVMHLPTSDLDLTQSLSLHIASGGQLIALVNTYGQYGLLLNLTSKSTSMYLARDIYHKEHSQFPIAFFTHNQQLFLVYATAWNRLDIFDPWTGELLTSRDLDSTKAHSLDYFHCSLSVSPQQTWIADNGWRWTPMGRITTWNLQQWLQHNVWESEDGPSKKSFYDRWYYWDGPLCWIDDHTLAVWGYGRDEEWLLPAVQLFDVVLGEEKNWFIGPSGTLFFDDYLFSCSPQTGFSTWDVATGERLLHLPDICPSHYHHGTKQFLRLNLDGTIAFVGRLIL